MTGNSGMELPVDATFVTTHPTLFDAYYIVGGTLEDQPIFDEHVKEFTRMAYKFFKPIGVATTGVSYLDAVEGASNSGVIKAQDQENFASSFVDAIAQKRFWDRF